MVSIISRLESNQEEKGSTARDERRDGTVWRRVSDPEDFRVRLRVTMVSLISRHGRNRAEKRSLLERNWAEKRLRLEEK
jgi:hypothetical protein